MTIRRRNNLGAMILGLWICTGPSSPLHGQEKVRLEVLPAQIVLSGMTEGRQLIVTATGPDQRLRDLTRKVSYTAADPKIVAVSAHGFVRPLAKGETTVTIEAA